MEERQVEQQKDINILKEIWKIQKKIVNRYGNYGIKVS